MQPTEAQIEAWIEPTAFFSLFKGSEPNAELVSLLDRVREVYRHVEPERSTRWIISPVTEIDQAAFAATPTVVGSPVQLATSVGPTCVIGLNGDRFTCWNMDPIPPNWQLRPSLYYEINSNGEWLEREGSRYKLPPYGGGVRSLLAVKCFPDVREALAEYSVKKAAKCSCLILQQCFTDDRRVILINKPEKVMRRSLHAHLQSAIRGAVEVLQEQNVDETHPVDIKVVWSGTNRLVIIEIKWLGVSLDKDGIGLGQPFWAGRANEGAEQLAEYLDANTQSAPTSTILGILAVFDARRQGVTSVTASPTAQQGLHYQHEEIAYDPDFSLRRLDFDPPIRFYIEPKL